MDGIKAVAITDDAAFAVNSEGEIIAWNGAAERSLGYRCSEVVGRRCWRVLKGRNLSSNPYCVRSCPVLARVSQGEPAKPEQMLFSSIDRAQVLVRNALGETTRVKMSTYLVQGEAGTRDVVHFF